MSVNQKLMYKAIEFMQKKGITAVELAKQSVLEEQIIYEPLREAVVQFIMGWDDILHPAILTIACEAVGGKSETATKIGAALVLLAGGADIHDDIIDKTVVKGSKETIFGKFGNDIAILAGDSLLLKGVYLLHEACQRFSAAKKKKILEIVRRTFFEISSAEAAEADMRGHIDIDKQEYLDLIQHKVAAGEAASRIGAIVGEGPPEEIKILAEFGRTFGYLLTLRDEFVDIFEQDELQNRIKKECLPLPILIALRDESKRSTLLDLLQGDITEDKIERIIKIVILGEGTKRLISEMKLLVDQMITELAKLNYCKKELSLLLEATLEDL